MYSAPLEKRLALTFSLYDFNSDGIVHPEDVKMMLKYIDFDTFTVDGEIKKSTLPKEGTY